ncbi:MAG: hypothetical protein AAF653_02390, partial [Chloroflexota bacterium]
MGKMEVYSNYFRQRWLVAAVLLLMLLAVGGYSQAQITSIKINFQKSGSAPAGYDADYGDAYGSRSNGETYGWRSVNTDAPFDAAVNSRNRSNNSITLANTLMHLRYNECCSTGNSGTQEPVYWEIALPNGTYEVTVSVGDSSNDSQPTVHVLEAEGVVLTDGSNGKSPTEYPSQQITVTDGALTLDQGTGGFNTKINYVEIDLVDTAPEPALFDVKVNFQKSGNAPDGYLADYGNAYGDRGDGETYGWIVFQQGTDASVGAPGTPYNASDSNGTNGEARNRGRNGIPFLQDTVIHL